MIILVAKKNSAVFQRPNWLLFWLICLSLAIHAATVFHLSPLFRSRKVECIEIEIRSTQKTAAPDIPQIPNRNALLPRVHKTDMDRVIPVPIPETDMPVMDAPAIPVPSGKASVKQPEKEPNVSQPEVLPWSPPKIAKLSPPAPPNTLTHHPVRPRPASVHTQPISAPEVASPVLEASPNTPSTFPSATQPEKPRAKTVRAVSWSGPKTERASESSGEKQSGNYFGLVRARIENSKKYPPAARRSGVEGQVLVQFSIGLDGSLKDLKILKKSSHAVLDSAALSAVERAAPFPKPPKGRFTGPIPLQITIVFHMAKR